MNRVLVFFGEESQSEDLSLMLRHEGVQATFARSAETMLAALGDPYDAVLADLERFRDLPALSQIQAKRIAVATRDQVDALVDSLGRDIDDYLMAPVRREELRLALHRPRATRTGVTSLQTIIGTSGGLAKPWAIAQKAAGFDADVLLTGESGTGKELFARAIHRLSGRNTGAFVAVNCAAIPEGLAESLLFGHVKGAFTGAHIETSGVFAQANGGTLFLDEVGDLGEEIQVKLLRALQTGEVQPLGSATSIRADVRVVAATSRDLPAMMGTGQFREDLYYRLAVIPIVLPPLRERLEDFDALVTHFLGFFTARHQAGVLTLAPEARRLLARASWPGNVRQLQNAVERLVVLCDGPEIGTDLVRREIRSPDLGMERDLPQTLGDCLQGRTLKEALRCVEAQYIAQALAECGGKRGECAKRLSISPRALLYKLKEYSIQ